ncbi:hypothetical protein C8F04DRAFT_1222353 [Mycena alexandri]|uniref:ubiquitinyl hydrolase 1 n=1 Tax=Mycena alexandri TaxID=1745969 RepID=A0AAD6SMN7_9AGAR|nr:hypothetical protein C8F04DRAFT_1222353 [Mycena alexandri]
MMLGTWTGKRLGAGVGGNPNMAGPQVATDGVVSVRDRDAAAQYMPKLDHNITDSTVYAWRLQNWKKSEKKLTSDEFWCGGHKWRILLFPFGNSTTTPNEAVSIYLDCAGPNQASENWHACVQFALVISNIHDPTVFTASHAQHRFIAEESDWGFTRFSDLGKLFNPQGHSSRPTIEEDAADITAYLRVVDDPTGVLWHNFINYDSKKETGYVGLKNQGATAYMDSLLQLLFCIHYFRRAVYQIPTEDDLPTESVALALQRVFYHLQTSDNPVGTTELTKSFGWKALDSFIAHNVHEFSRVLLDKMESKMKVYFSNLSKPSLNLLLQGTKAEGAIAKLFSGKMKSYIKCVHVDYEASRIEEFSDIQLNVKGMKNLYESFKDYVAVETYDGENKYLAEGFGLQDAKKGIIFHSFPPVLRLQLKRYDYDMQRDSMVKLNDRHEFPPEIDLGGFLDLGADRSKPWIYKLHGVIVHSGDLHKGHNFVFIKPDLTRATDKQVFEDNYGAKALDGLPSTAQFNQDKTSKDFSSNAYVLVYIRESAIDQVLAPFTDEDIPPHIKARLDEEHLQLEAMKREREQQDSFITAKVVTDDTFSCHEGFDLATFDEKNPSFRVLKQETFSTFKARVAQHFGYRENQFRLWVIVNRQNKTVRLDVPIPENNPALNLELIRNNMAAKQDDLRLYLDIIPDPFKPDPPPQSIMIFLKHFDASKQTLFGIGKAYMLRTSLVSELVHVINQRMRWKPGTPLKLYEVSFENIKLSISLRLHCLSKEIKPGMVLPMAPRRSVSESELMDGDIICFQVNLPLEESRDLERRGQHSNPIQFYDFLQNRVLIFFRPKFEETNHDHPKFGVVFSKKQNYDTMSAKAGEFLCHPAIKLRFTTTEGTSGSPKSVLKWSLNQSIAEIMSVAPIYNNPTTIILYEKLDVSIVELETKRSLRVVWTGIHNKEEATHPFLVPKTSTVNDLADHISKLVTLTPSSSQKIRVFEISKDGKTRKEFTGFEMIGNIPESVELYAEQIPLEDPEVDDSDKFIGVFHFSKELSRTHGVPFNFMVKRGEKFADTKKRLQARIDVSDKDFAKYRFALILVSTLKQPSYIEDDDIIYDHPFTPEDVLGLDHADRSGKPRVAGAQTRLTIRG